MCQVFHCICASHQTLDTYNSISQQSHIRTASKISFPRSLCVRYCLHCICASHQTLDTRHHGLIKRVRDSAFFQKRLKVYKFTVRFSSEIKSKISAFTSLWALTATSQNAELFLSIQYWKICRLPFLSCCPHRDNCDQIKRMRSEKMRAELCRLKIS
jgi:hypothetical protein